MKTNFEMVGEFMNAFGQEVKTTPHIPDRSVCEFRIKLIKEEFDEVVHALLFSNKEDKKLAAEVAKELTDLLYVVYGAGHAFGIDLDKCFAEVQRSNMSKLGADGKPIKREDGKILKGPNYSEADLTSIIGD
jgi:predicted HAD superfamily Cof-like phosphohydrolase